jgi:hypothetical protein
MTYASEHHARLEIVERRDPANPRASMPEIHLALGSEVLLKGRFTLFHLFAERSTEARLAACFPWVARSRLQG